MFLLTLLATASAFVQNCNPSSVFQTTELSLTPDPPIPGKPFVLTLVFQNPASTITNGTITSSTTIDYVPYPTSTAPLCEDTKCPIQPGKNDRSATTVWPTSVSGHITGKEQWYDGDGNELLCIHMSFTVAPTFWRSLAHSMKHVLCHWIDCSHKAFRFVRMLSGRPFG
jgi:hypothetical protein